MFYFPAILSLAIVGLIWNWIYLPDIGLINQVLGALGLTALQHNWLSDPNFALYAVMLAATWNATGLPMLLFLAGLQTINPEVLEAAKVDGATNRQVFYKVTLPYISATVVAVATITAIGALKVFDIVAATTGGNFGTSTVANEFYRVYFVQGRLGFGSAYAVLLFLLVIPVVVMNRRAQQRAEERS